MTLLYEQPAKECFGTEVHGSHIVIPSNVCNLSRLVPPHQNSLLIGKGLRTVRNNSKCFLVLLLRRS